MSDKEVKVLSSELGHYEATERTGHYLKAYDGDARDGDLTLLIRDDQWDFANGNDYLKYHTAAVAISREDAVAFANWILERFDE